MMNEGFIRFAVIAFAASWSPWLLVVVVDPGNPAVRSTLVVLGLYGPFVAGLSVAWRKCGSVRGGLASILTLRARIVWYIAGFFVPAGVFLAAVVVAGALPTSSAVLDPVPLQAYPFMFLLAVFVAGGQEEPGWRGFAFPSLLPRHGILGASIVVGAAWGIWHLPLFLLPDTPLSQVSPVAFMPAILGFSVLLGWIRERSGAVGPAVVMHAQVNALGPFLPVPPDMLWWLLAVFSVAAAALVVVLDGYSTRPKRHDSGG